MTRKSKRELERATDSPSTMSEDTTREHGQHVGLLISEQCEYLIRELLGYKETYVGTAAAEDYCADALRYAVMGVGGEPDVVVRKANFSVQKRSRLPDDRQ